MKELIKTAIIAAIEGGKEIMNIYDTQNFKVETKGDDSPITIADKKANEIINKILLPTGIPVISEENRQVEYRERKKWKECWIVDPLDGTKEFIKKNGEFTVNIALIKNEKPVLGIIYVPAEKDLYFADVLEKKAYKIIPDNNLENYPLNAREIKPVKGKDKIRVVGSRSHMNKETIDFINSLKEKYNKDVEIISKGSSLKFCLMAEGLADIYPRLGPTMEWDTAAGHAICNAVGLEVVDLGTSKPMLYNREDLLNNYFLVSNLG